MKILSRVCADFHDKKGNVIYKIGPADRLRYIDDAPEAIKDDVLFGMLVADGSMEVIETAAQKKAAEQDPMAGALADGRKADAVNEENEEKKEETKSAGSKKKTGTKEGDKA